MSERIILAAVLGAVTVYGFLHGSRMALECARIVNRKLLQEGTRLNDEARQLRAELSQWPALIRSLLEAFRLTPPDRLVGTLGAQAAVEPPARPPAPSLVPVDGTGTGGPL